MSYSFKRKDGSSYSYSNQEKLALAVSREDEGRIWSRSWKKNKNKIWLKKKTCTY